MHRSKRREGDIFITAAYYSVNVCLVNPPKGNYFMNLFSAKGRHLTSSSNRSRNLKASSYETIVHSSRRRTLHGERKW